MWNDTCPEENDLVAYLQGDLEERAAMEDHLDTCSLCALLVMELGALADLSQASRDEAYATGALTRPDRPGAGSTAEHPALATTFLDRYELREILGRGGMGVVFEAWDLSLERKVAVKLVRPDLSDPELRDHLSTRMLREARALARLSHPNVLTVFEVGTHEGALYLVTEHLEGQTLDTLGPLPAEEAIDLYLGALAGLEHAHEEGVTHRDIKPSNIMRTHRGDAVVLDFGLATGAAPEDLALTRTGAVLGTPAYMSPEQHMGQRVGPASDVFSLCASLYEALYAQRPFSGQTSQEIAMRAYAGEVRVPDDHPRLFEVLRRGLQASPEARYPDAGALRAALLEARTQASTKRTLPWPLLAGAAALAAVAIALVVTSQPDPPTKTPTAPAVTSAPQETPKQPTEAPAPPEPPRAPPEAFALATRNVEDARRVSALLSEQHVTSVKTPAPRRAPRTGGPRVPLAPSKAASPKAKASPKPVDIMEVTKRGYEATYLAQLHDVRGCYRLLQGLPEDQFMVQLARAHCMMAEGKCDAAEKRIRKVQAHQPGDVAAVQARLLREQLCPPAKSDPGPRLRWEISPFAARASLPVKKSSCVREAKRALKVLRRPGAMKGVSDDDRIKIAASLESGIYCFRAKAKGSCDLVRDLLAEAALWRFRTMSDDGRADLVQRELPFYPACK